MRSFKIILLLSFTALVSACGTIISGQTQDVTLQTPGTDNAECTMDNGNRYRAETGDKLKVMRSYKPLELDCYAPGNRHVTKTVGEDLNAWSAANVVNGVVPGVAYDHFSGGLYTYPDVIVVDFTGVEAPGFNPPEYVSPDDAGKAIESYQPGNPIVPGDSTYMKRGVQKVDQDLNSNPFDLPSKSAAPSSTAAPAANSGSTSAVHPTPKMPSSTDSATPAAPVLKGSNAEQLNRSMNPTVFDK